MPPTPQLIHEVQNTTPHRAALALARDADGRQVAVAIVKITYVFSEHAGASSLTLLDRSDPRAVDVALHDQYGEPGGDGVGSAGLLLASDVSPSRSGTSVVVRGHAYLRGARSISAGVLTAAANGVVVQRKLLRVCGPRAMSKYTLAGVVGPVPCDRVAVSYEQAYGGTYDDGGQRCAFAMNPLGKGFVESATEGVPLPSVEYPDDPWRKVGRHPRPAALGFVPPGWSQRALLAGRLDQAWLQSRAPRMPPDFDARFYDPVAQDQVVRPALRGGERLLLQNLHPSSDRVVLDIPQLDYVARFVIRGARSQCAMVADTVLVEPDVGRLAITLRATVALATDARLLQSVTLLGPRAAVPA